MSDTHDISVQDIVKQLETQKPSFDEIEGLYVTHKRNPVYLEALSIYFDAKAYDEYGMYPIQPRVVAIGDVHGDLRVTLMALRLAKVIGDNIYTHNVKDIQRYTLKNIQNY